MTAQWVVGGIIALGIVSLGIPWRSESYDSDCLICELERCD